MTKTLIAGLLTAAALLGTPVVAVRLGHLAGVG